MSNINASFQSAISNAPAAFDRAYNNALGVCNRAYNNARDRAANSIAMERIGQFQKSTQETWNRLFASTVEYLNSDAALKVCDATSFL